MTLLAFQILSLQDLEIVVGVKPGSRIFVASHKSPTFAVQSNNGPSTPRYSERCYVIMARLVAWQRKDEDRAL